VTVHRRIVPSGSGPDKGTTGLSALVRPPMT
jgi:hypothetical protein